MSRLDRIAQLSARSAPGMDGDVGGSSGDKRARSSGRLSWELVAGALAQPRKSADKKAPLEEYARLLVLGELTPAGLDRIIEWIQRSDPDAEVIHARAALYAVLKSDVCKRCNALGTVMGGTRVCSACDGAGVVYPGERVVADLLGVTRHSYRVSLREQHKRLVGRVMELQVMLEDQLTK